LLIFETKDDNFYFKQNRRERNLHKISENLQKFESSAKELFRWKLKSVKIITGEFIIDETAESETMSHFESEEEDDDEK
jgi:hypothetical protein